MFMTIIPIEIANKSSDFSHNKVITSNTNYNLLSVPIMGGLTAILIKKATKNTYFPLDF